MGVKLRKPHHELMQPSQSLGTPNDEPVDPGADNTNVLVNYGTHSGRFPIGGMTVGAARGVLQRLINIDPTAVAVIHGAPVDEDRIVEEDVTLLTFVKPSAIKG